MRLYQHFIFCLRVIFKIFILMIMFLNKISNSKYGFFFIGVIFVFFERRVAVIIVGQETLSTFRIFDYLKIRKPNYY